MFSVLLDIYLGGELLGHMVTLDHMFNFGGNCSTDSETVAPLGVINLTICSIWPKFPKIAYVCGI